MTNAKGMPNGMQPVCVAGSDFENSGFFRHWSFVIRISVKAFAKPAGDAKSMLWPQQDRFLVRAFDLDAVRFDGRIVLQPVVDNAAIESVQRFEFHDVAPTPDFFLCLLRLLHH